MAFVNEMISDESIKKYKLEEFEWNYFVFRRESEGFPVSHLKDAQWTVDHKRGMWLRQLEHRRETEGTNEYIWAFFWQSELLIFIFNQTCGFSDALRLSSWAHYELLQIKLPRWDNSFVQSRSPNPLPKPYIQLPERLKSLLPAIYLDLKEALTSFACHDCRSNVPANTRHQATFDF